MSIHVNRTAEEQADERRKRDERLAEPVTAEPAALGLGNVGAGGVGGTEPAASWPDAEGCIAIGSGSPQPQKPKAIMRYKLDAAGKAENDYYGEIIEDDDGDLVSYADLIAALTHRDADVGREELLPLISRAVMEVRADGDDTWRSSHLADILIPAILEKFHVAKKG